ncbi:MAG: nuclear transport factor 2 family protein [Saprospiraceae bacterium]
MQSLEIVKQYYAAFNQKNWAGMIALVDPEIRHEVNQGEVRIGQELYTQFLQLMDESYEETLQDLVFMSNDTGERIAAEFVVHGIYKKGDEGMPPAHGQSYVLPAGAFLEVKNGKICRVTTYYNLPLWLKLVSE